MAAQADFSEPWAPIVLSLDGGGVRGLSSLYILREIMKKVKALDAADPEEHMEVGDNTIPLPCNYFDLIVGTSTGGLIAIMLGRLRMGVNDCIKQYWILSNTLFRPPRTRCRLVLQKYSRRSLKSAAVAVVQRHCQCHNPQHPQDTCDGLEHLRQFDFAETGDVTQDRYQDMINHTCRVVVITVREAGHTTSEEDRSFALKLFRSYNHSGRVGDQFTLRPRTIEDSELRIHDACCATAAAPTYFRPIEINGKKYVDGGIMANNPAMVAWNEATHLMSHIPNIMLSIGTGKGKEVSGLGLTAMIRYGLKKITSSSQIDNAMTLMTQGHPWRYHRFSVPPTVDDERYKGLEKIKLDQCKKKERRVPQRNVNPAEREDAPLRQAAANMERRRRDGYKPDKYDYTTFDKLRDRTLAYCTRPDANVHPDDTISAKIEKCANLIRRFSLERRSNDRARWDRFRQHPSPHYHAPTPENAGVPPA